MSDSLDFCDLYQEVILDHGRYPRNRRAMADCSHMAHGENLSCGDEVVVVLKTDGEGVIRDVAFDGQSCAIATASASLMTEVLVGKTLAQAKNLFDRFYALATGGAEAPLDGMEGELERLTMLSGVRDYPVREKCATLAWQTMSAALENPRQPTLSIDRTVLVFAGSMSLINLALSRLFSPGWLLLTAWIGVVMLQSGFTGFGLFGIQSIESGTTARPLQTNVRISPRGSGP